MDGPGNMATGLELRDDTAGIEAGSRTKISQGLRRASHHWAWQDVATPFVLTRLALVLVSWFAQYLPINSGYPTDAIGRGWNFVPERWLDIWGRWDTGWYLSIAIRGYSAPTPGATEYSSIAFFPLYPYLIRGLMFLFPTDGNPWSHGMVLGAILSNLMLVAGLLLLHRLTTTLTHDRGVAQRTVLYLLLFPTGFILSSVYSEAAFLMLNVGAFYAATRRRWLLAGVLGGLVALTRPLGVAILLPLAWLYLDSIAWQWRRVRLDVLWLALVPVALGLHLASLYQLSGDFLGPLRAQQAWSKEFTWPWVTLLDQGLVTQYLTKIEQVSTLLFLALAVATLWLLPSRSYGLYALLLILPTLFTGTLISVVRYYGVIFPIFIVLAHLGRRKLVDQTITLFFWTVQVLYMVAWSQFYWVT